MTRPTSSNSSVSRKWRKLFKLLPGYDPIATAGKGDVFDEAAADKALSFFDQCLHHVKGEMAGKPLTLEPHEKALTGCIIGWKDAAGRRRYREVFYFVPRKNSKSTWAAGMACLMLFTDPEPGAELYSTAADRDQAALVYQIAKQMVAMEPALKSRAKIHETSKTIQFQNSYYRAISADANTKHGYNTHCAINDELHAHRNGELLDVIQTSTGARRQPLIIHITTSDFEREGSICNQKHDYATKVRDGVITDRSFLPVIFEASKDDDWTDPKTWAKANPMLGKSISHEYLERECIRAQEEPTYENTFKRLHLNIRTEQAVRAIPLEQWDKGAKAIDVTSIPPGRPCYGGLDLATRNDIAAWVLLFPPTDDDEEYLVVPRFFCPENRAADRERKEGVPYQTWGTQGVMTLTSGDVIDYGAIREQIIADGERFNIIDIGADRWNLEALRQQLGDIGVDVVEFGQGYASMSEPTKELLQRILPAGKLRHGGNPVLRWMATNVSTTEDAAANIKFDRKRSSDKIDGMIALVMALGRAMVSEGEKLSVYETRGVVMV